MITLDIGNTVTKLARFEDNTIKELIRFVDTNNLIKKLVESDTEEIAVASVVPDRTQKLIEHFDNRNIFQIDHSLKFNIGFNYFPFTSLGIDRICAMEGALVKTSEKKKENRNILVIDFGTATTINFISDKKFIGGTIAPGANLMFNSLSEKTAQLPSVNNDDFDEQLSNTTEGSIASGVIYSVTGQITSVLSYIKNKFETIPEIFITGGNYSLISSHFDFEYEFVEGLNLWGIKSIYELNTK